ncbi:MAG: hypothetical protein J6T74_00320 [Clostridia bacterium]|nr:hypothetical protein [Clostridia bacterium]
MTNKTNKKGNKKQFKYELLVLIILSLFDIYCIIYHITLNGFNLTNIIREIIIYSLITFMIYYITKDIRKNPKEYSLKELCK